MQMPVSNKLKKFGRRIDNEWKGAASCLEPKMTDFKTVSSFFFLWYFSAKKRGGRGGWHLTVQQHVPISNGQQLFQTFAIQSTS